MRMSLDVAFQMTDLEYKPLAGETVRLVFGERRGWQDAGAGTRFVTGADGRTAFSTEAVVDRRWTWISIGFTGLSYPVRADHLAVAAELEQRLPAAGVDAGISLRLLYRMDIFVHPDGTCATRDFTSVYAPDATGRFVDRVPPAGLPIPDSGGMVLQGLGYQSWDHMLAPVTGRRNAWTLKLALKRMPPPVRR